MEYKKIRKYNGRNDGIFQCDYKGNSISVNKDGSVGEAFYQEEDFCANSHIIALTPKFENNRYVSTFLITVIKKEKYRYNFGRAWGLNRMKQSSIKLPSTKEGNPDWKWMENYIKTLAFSKHLA